MISADQLMSCEKELQEEELEEISAGTLTVTSCLGILIATAVIGHKLGKEEAKKRMGQ